MKLHLATALLMALPLSTLIAQKSLNTKWNCPTIGGKKGYYTKTYTFTKDKMVESQTGSGGPQDNKPTTVPVVAVITNADNEQLITKYDDTTFLLIQFKNMTAKGADVCLHTETFNTIEAAKAYVPTANDYIKWFTEIGYKEEMKKPAIPELTKKDVLAITTEMSKTFAEGKAKLTGITNEDEKMGALLGVIMRAQLTPMTYAESKGYNPYKSLPVLERGLKKFEKDKDIAKLLKEMEKEME